MNVTRSTKEWLEREVDRSVRIQHHRLNFDEACRRPERQRHASELANWKRHYLGWRASSKT